MFSATYHDKARNVRPVRATPHAAARCLRARRDRQPRACLLLTADERRTCAPRACSCWTRTRRRSQTHSTGACRRPHGSGVRCTDERLRRWVRAYAADGAAGWSWNREVRASESSIQLKHALNNEAREHRCAMWRRRAPAASRLRRGRSQTSMTTAPAQQSARTGASQRALRVCERRIITALMPVSNHTQERATAARGHAPRRPAHRRRRQLPPVGHGRRKGARMSATSLWL